MTDTTTFTHNVAIGTPEYEVGFTWWNKMCRRFRKSLLLRSRLYSQNGKLTREGITVIDGSWRDLTPRERAVLLANNRHLIVP
jgi:tmRNA-binding protein